MIYQEIYTFRPVSKYQKPNHPVTMRIHTIVPSFEDTHSPIDVQFVEALRTAAALRVDFLQRHLHLSADCLLLRCILLGLQLPSKEL